MIGNSYRGTPVTYAGYIRYIDKNEQIATKPVMNYFLLLTCFGKNRIPVKTFVWFCKQ